MYERNSTPEKKPPKQSPQSYAVWLLSRRDYSAKELHTKLVTRGYSVEQADSAMAKLQSYGLQNDERYAGSAARSNSRRMGNRQIVAKLTDKGLDKELVASQVDTLAPEVDRALELAQRFVGKELDDKMKAKVWRFFASRGFSGNSVDKAMRYLKEQAKLAKERAEELALVDE